MNFIVKMCVGINVYAHWVEHANLYSGLFRIHVWMTSPLEMQGGFVWQTICCREIQNKEMMAIRRSTIELASTP